MRNAARAAWRSLPLGVRQTVWRAAGPTLWDLYARRTLARPAADMPDGPLVVAGLFRMGGGLGEAARGTWHALRAAGFDPLAVDLSETFGAVDVDSGIPLHAMPNDRYGTLILQLNGAETSVALDRLAMRPPRKWFVVGYWAWELAVFPAGWDRAFDYLSAIWTPSVYSAVALRHQDAPPIHVVSHAVQPPADLPTIQRARFGIEAGSFVTVVIADAASSFDRKGVRVAIESHEKAFGEDPRHVLLLKLRRGMQPRKDVETALALPANARVFDRPLDEADKWALLNAADVVLCLHRSEGFGLVAAETMAIGGAVVTTAYSGVVDFLDETCAMMVDYELVAVRDTAKVYRFRNAVWAEPDLEEAAAALRLLATDEALRQRLGSAARERATSLLAPPVVGARMRKLLVDTKK